MLGKVANKHGAAVTGCAGAADGVSAPGRPARGGGMARRGEKPRGQTKKCYDFLARARSAGGESVRAMKTKARRRHFSRLSLRGSRPAIVPRARLLELCCIADIYNVVGYN